MVPRNINKNPNRRGSQGRIAVACGAVFALTSGSPCCCLLHRPEKIPHRLRRHLCSSTRWRRSSARAIRHKAHMHRQYLQRRVRVMLYLVYDNFSEGGPWEGWKKTTHHTLDQQKVLLLLSLLILPSQVSMHFLPENPVLQSVSAHKQSATSPRRWRGSYGVFGTDNDTGSSCCVMKCEARKEDKDRQAKKQSWQIAGRSGTLRRVSRSRSAETTHAA